MGPSAHSVWLLVEDHFCMTEVVFCKTHLCESLEQWFKRSFIALCLQTGIIPVLEVQLSLETSSTQHGRMNILNKETMLKSAFFQNWTVMYKGDFSVWKASNRFTQTSIFCPPSVILVIPMSVWVNEFSQAGKVGIGFLQSHSQVFPTTESLFKVYAHGNLWRTFLSFSCWSEKLCHGSLRSLCSYPVQSTFQPKLSIITFPLFSFLSSS